jgi:hypothetical protein
VTLLLAVAIAAAAVVGGRSAWQAWRARRVWRAYGAD